MSRIPEWRYHVRRTVALMIVAALFIGTLDLLGIELIDPAMR